MQGLTSEVASEILRLATSAFGLVAALAWNDAVQALFREYLPISHGIAAKFGYAVLLSALIVIVTINLTKLSRLANGEQKKP